MSDLRDLQKEVADWASRQPWRDDTVVEATLGLAEEAGEVCRAVLKQHQGIRGSREHWQEELAKELGDVLIKLCDVASRAGMDIETIVEARWASVRQRDFTLYPEKGLPSPETRQ